MRKRYIQHPVTHELIPAEEYISPYEEKSAAIIKDITPYRSMQTGEYIESRSKHRDHLKRHGLIEVGNETSYVTKQKQVELNRSGAKEMLSQIVHSKL